MCECEQSASIRHFTAGIESRSETQWSEAGLQAAQRADRKPIPVGGRKFCLAKFRMRIRLRMRR